MIGDKKTNFLNKLLLTDRQIASLRQVFANELSGNKSHLKT